MISATTFRLKFANMLNLDLIALEEASLLFHCDSNSIKMQLERLASNSILSKACGIYLAFY